MENHRRVKVFQDVARVACLFILCGALYVLVEMVYRGRSHISMFLLAGVCGVFFIDTPNNIYSFDLDYPLQVAISTALCTIAEGLTGLYVNVYHHWNVWHYSDSPFTFFWGQCSVPFVIAWACIIGFVGIPFCDAFNYYVCGIEPRPYYKFFGKTFLRFPERVEHE